MRSLPENWPVGVHQHSWVVTIALALVLSLAGVVVYSLWHAEKTAQAAAEAQH